MSLSLQPYKGTRDYYPADKRLQNYIFNTCRKVCESFGYEDYGTPTLEPVEIFAAKTGQEIVNDQTYRFIDRGGRDVVIRPELTPSTCRLVAARRQEMPVPARLFSIANFMRYERPQRGREREFWQLNVDIFGVQTIDAEVEIISMADKILREFGATKDMYIIKINSRSLINFMMSDYLGLDIIQSQLMIKLFDRKDKITAEQFGDQAAEIFDPAVAKDGLKKIAQLFAAKNMADLPEVILKSEAIKEVQTLFTILKDHGIKSVTFDIGLMRGFDYYTDIVFEVFDTNPENRRALFGGGRYDGLIGLFGVEPMSAVGFAPGVTSVENFLKTHDLVPQLRTATEVYIVVLGEELHRAQKLATELRENGVNAELDITRRRIEKQIKTAVKKGIPFIIFAGAKELDEQIYSLKELDTEKEHKLSLPRLVSMVKDYRHDILEDLE